MNGRRKPAVDLFVCDKRSSAPCRMKAAACWSITAARFLRLTSASINSRSTAKVESRSSHSAIGSGVNLPRLRAKARVDCARGPSLPSIFKGNPSTKPTPPRSPASTSRRLTSVEKLVRMMVVTPVATRRSVSDVATPMVLLPRSRPISAPRGGRTSSETLRIASGMRSMSG
jgi:hypothetical protein